MTSAGIIARKEFSALAKDPLVAVLVGFLVLASVLSIAVAAAGFKVQLDAYDAYVQLLLDSGSSATPPAPGAFPMQQLRGGVEYLEILGALFAIVLGYGSIARERSRGTMLLLLTRPLGRTSIALGKIWGLALVWLAVVVVIFLVSIIELLAIGNAPLGGDEYLRLGLTALIVWGYLVLWSSMAVATTAASSKVSSGLILSLILWLVFVLLIPQIGDTMDPDNQVPGGLFASLQIQKSDEVTVLANFTGYDQVRNGLETSSITKHFERISFALLGIKEKYNQQPLGFIWADMWGYALALLGATLASISIAVGASSRRNLQRRTK